jgi:hypothetical protein
MTDNKDAEHTEPKASYKTEFERKMDVAKGIAIEGLAKTVRVINHKVVKNTTAFAKEVLDITDKMKNGNVVSRTAAIVASVESFAKLLNVPKPDEVKDYAIDNELAYTDYGQLSELLLNKAVFSKLKNEVVAENDSQALIKLHFDDKNFVCFIRSKKDEQYFDSKRAEADLAQASYYEAYYLPKDFDISVVYKMFWDMYDNKIFLTAKRDKIHGPIRGFKFDLENVFLNHEEIDRIGHEIATCSKNNISRSYLLVGEPGLGKTTRCFAACKQFCPRVLKVDSSAVDYLNIGDLENHIANFKPDALILDDIDRAPSDKASYFLFTLENIKKTFPNMVLFATANYFNKLDKAIVRPGRFDRIIWVEPPTNDDRAKLISSFATAFDAQIDSDTLAYLAKETEGFSHAYIKELVLRISHAENQKVAIDESLIEFKRTLELGGDIDSMYYSE